MIIVTTDIRIYLRNPAGYQLLLLVDKGYLHCLIVFDLLVSIYYQGEPIKVTRR